jgi:hypothetical protein
VNVSELVFTASISLVPLHFQTGTSFEAIWDLQKLISLALFEACSLHLHNSFWGLI